MTDDVGEPLMTVPIGRTGEALVFTADASGWCRYLGPDFPTSCIYLRLARTADESAYAVREIHMAFRVGLGTRNLRALPLGRIEAAANTPEAYEALSARIQPTSAPTVPMPEEIQEARTASGWPQWTAAVAPRRAPRLKIKVPDGHRKPDRFYEQVAERFAYLAVVSQQPAVVLANANGVPVTTVHGWVKEARRRGLLPASERTRKRSDE